MATLAAVADVETRWRVGSFLEQPVIEALLVDASATVRRHFPTVDARIADTTLSNDLVVKVVSGMVIRVLKNRYPDARDAFDPDNAQPPAWEVTPRLSADDRRDLATATTSLRSTRITASIGPVCDRWWW